MMVSTVYGYSCGRSLLTYDATNVKGRQKYRFLYVSCYVYDLCFCCSNIVFKCLKLVIKRVAIHESTTHHQDFLNYHSVLYKQKGFQLDFVPYQMFLEKNEISPLHYTFRVTILTFSFIIVITMQIYTILITRIENATGITTWIPRLEDENYFLFPFRCKQEPNRSQIHWTSTIQIANELHYQTPRV